MEGEEGRGTWWTLRQTWRPSCTKVCVESGGHSAAAAAVDRTSPSHKCIMMASPGATGGHAGRPTEISPHAGNYKLAQGSYLGS